MSEGGHADRVGGPDADWLDDGPPPLTSVERRRRRKIVALLVGLVVVISGVSVAVNRSQEDAAVSDPTPDPATSSPSLSPRSLPRTSRRPPGPVVVSDKGPFAPGFDDAVLFARSGSTVYRVELKTGRVVATPGADVTSTGPSAFVAGRSQVIIRPWDSVPGLVVPDDGPPRLLTGLLGQGVQVLQGPPGQVWVSRQVNYERDAVMTLVSLDGGGALTQVSGGGSFESDGVGGLLLSDVGGVWEASAKRLRRVTTGAVAAMGPHHYLFVNCDRDHRCASSLYDRQERTQRTLGPIDTASVPRGSISPDGKFVALMKRNTQGSTLVDVISLASGASITTEPQSDDSFYDVTSTLIWSRDSRYLFAIRRGDLIVIDSRNGQTRVPELPMHDLLQLALRPPN